MTQREWNKQHKKLKQEIRFLENDISLKKEQLQILLQHCPHKGKINYSAGETLCLNCLKTL